MDYLLSIACGESGEEVSIHLNIAGIEALEESLALLKAKLIKGECEHDHFHSKSWAGEELSESMLEQEKAERFKQVQHLKLYGWTPEWKSNHKL